MDVLFSLTSALDGRVWSTSLHPSVRFTTGKGPVPIYKVENFITSKECGNGICFVYMLLLRYYTTRLTLLPYILVSEILETELQ